MRIGHHAKVRYVQRVLKMGHLDEQQMTEYIRTKLDEIDDAITEMYEQSFFIFRKLFHKPDPAVTTMRAYYYNGSGLIIVKDEEADSIVTMFEPRLSALPPGLRSKDVTLGMAKTISEQFAHLDSLYDNISGKTEKLVTDREVLHNKIEQMKAELQELDRELQGAWKPYELAERKVLEMGSFLTDDRGRGLDEEDAEVTAG